MTNEIIDNNLALGHSNIAPELGLDDNLGTAKKEHGDRIEHASGEPADLVEAKWTENES